MGNCFWRDDDGTEYEYNDLIKHYRESLYPWLETKADDAGGADLSGRNLASLVAACMFHVDPFPTGGASSDAEAWLRWVLREWRPFVPASWGVTLPYKFVRFLAPRRPAPVEAAPF